MRRYAMDKEKLAAAVEPAALGNYLVNLPRGHAHGANGLIETLRMDEHKGHSIVIHTTYLLEIDGKALQVPLSVDNEGRLHCHSLPNYQFRSAIDMVKYLIDIFPNDFSLEQKAEE
jgi:hypothetical protein